MTQTFADFQLLASLHETLAEKALVTPTEIQSRVIPALLGGRTVVGVSATGSGKTLAYVLPLLDALKRLEEAGDPVAHTGRPRAVVVVPSRDLGEQVVRVFKLFTHTTRLRVRSILGGTKLEVARSNAAGAFEVLVATPGRLIKLMDDSLVWFGDVRVLVFDEADQMLDEGFLPVAKRIAAACPPKRQLALFSATIPGQVQALIAQMFTGAEMIRAGGSHQIVPTLVTSNRAVVGGDRGPLLDRVLAEKVAGGTLMFTNTREQCDTLASELTSRGYTVAVYRGEMDKSERRSNLKAFRDGEVRFLVSTDLASRGLDIDHVDRVVNYNMPSQMENYLHRVGRTARAGRAGLVINFVTDRDKPLITALAGGAPVKPRATKSLDAGKGRGAPRSERGSSDKGKPASGKSGTDKPRVRSDKPAARSDKPAGRTDKPRVRSDKPAARSDKPAARSDKPRATSTKPRTPRGPAPSGRRSR